MQLDQQALAVEEGVFFRRLYTFFAFRRVVCIGESHQSKQMSSIQETERGVTHLPAIVSHSHIHRDVHTHTNRAHKALQALSLCVNSALVGEGRGSTASRRCGGVWTVNEGERGGDQETTGRRGKRRTWHCLWTQTFFVLAHQVTRCFMPFPFVRCLVNTNTHPLQTPKLRFSFAF